MGCPAGQFFEQNVLPGRSPVLNGAACPGGPQRQARRFYESPVRVIALGFALVILLGSVLLIMPFSVQEGVDVAYIDTLYTSTSAVCVTGLIATDAGDTFTFVGQLILAALIQVGGLGVTSVGAGIILAMGRKINLAARST